MSSNRGKRSDNPAPGFLPRRPTDPKKSDDAAAQAETANPVGNRHIIQQDRAKYAYSARQQPDRKDSSAQAGPAASDPASAIPNRLVPERERASPLGGQQAERVYSSDSSDNRYQSGSSLGDPFNLSVTPEQRSIKTEEEVTLRPKSNARSGIVAAPTKRGSADNFTGFEGDDSNGGQSDKGPKQKTRGKFAETMPALGPYLSGCASVEDAIADLKDFRKELVGLRCMQNWFKNNNDPDCDGNYPGAASDIILTGTMNRIMDNKVVRAYDRAQAKFSDKLIALVFDDISKYEITIHNFREKTLPGIDEWKPNF